MVVVRDLFLGATRYNDFLRSPERITTNVLAERLQRLEREGIVAKTAYQEHPVRFEYRLTPKGRELAPVMRAMVAWAETWQAEVIRAPFPEGLAGMLVDRLEAGDPERPSPRPGRSPARSSSRPGRRKTRS